MHEKVRKYLSEKYADEEARRNRLLIEEGLGEMEYSDTKAPGFETYDYERKQYYREVAVPVTDEEYTEIVKYTRERHETRNRVATAFLILSWVAFIGGFILGIALGDVSARQFSLDSSIPTWLFWLSGVILGIMLRGFAEVVLLLQKIADRQKTTSYNIHRKPVQ